MSKHLRVAIRTDASDLIGSGHVMRTLAIAHRLRATGAEVTYLCRNRAYNMYATIEAAGFEVTQLPAVDAPADPWLGASYEQEIADSSRVLERCSPLDLILVDHYSIDARWEDRMREFSRRIMAIDDMANRQHNTDILLDQNLGADSGIYDSLAPSHTRRLLGPKFAMLREEFRPYVERPRERAGTIERILVFISGFDPGDETGKVLRALDMLVQRPHHVQVVLPEDAPHAASVREHCGSSGYQYLGRVRSMAPLMNDAGLAIGGVGSTTWERCAVGLPSVVITVAENQRGGAQAGAQAGAFCWLGDASSVDEEKIAQAVAQLQDDRERVRIMSQKARSVIGAEDGAFPMDRVMNCIFEVTA